MSTTPRFPPRTTRPVSIHGTAFFLNDELRGRGFVWNLSPTGCLVDAEKHVPVGAGLTITLHLSHADASIHVHRGVVAWSRGR